MRRAFVLLTTAVVLVHGPIAAAAPRDPCWTKPDMWGGTIEQIHPKAEEAPPARREAFMREVVASRLSEAKDMTLLGCEGRDEPCGAVVIVFRPSSDPDQMTRIAEVRAAYEEWFGGRTSLTLPKRCARHLIGPTVKRGTDLVIW